MRVVDLSFMLVREIMFLDSEQSGKAIDFTKICFSFLCSRELLQYSTKGPVSHKKSNILCALFSMFFQNFLSRKSYTQKTKEKLGKKR